MIMDVDIQLTRKYRENLSLGEYVTACARRLGIGCKRTLDRPSSNSSPNGAFLLGVSASPIVSWFHLACLGLKWQERTSPHKVRMDWMLHAPREFRLWFLRSLADSDGDVHFRDKSVDNITQHRFCKGTLGFLECPPRSAFHQGIWSNHHPCRTKQ